MPSPFLTRLVNMSIWWFAFGYFASYIPYSALTKAIASGRYPGLSQAVPGARMLPLSLLVTTCVMLLFLWLTGIVKHAHQTQWGPLSIRYPSKGPLLSGLCTSAIIVTTTLAYTFSGLSIVFAMLLMRGGLLILAPVVDAVSKRKTRWYSWVGLALSFAALLVAFAEKGTTAITWIAALDIGVYLAAYFVRLRLMSRLAKSDDPHKQLQFFAEEQLTAAPASLLIIVSIGLFFPGPFPAEIAKGLSFSHFGPAFWGIVLVGLFSQMTGIFGGLILLNKRENTFCVPVNRSSSIMAGVIASLVLTWWLGAPSPSAYQYTGAALIVVAILVLSLPSLMQKTTD